MPAQTFAPANGTDGRVKTHVGSYILAGIKSWARNGDAAIIELPNYESPADGTTGLVQPNHLLGMGKNTVDIEGFYNTNATDATETGTTGITLGAVVALDLYISRTNASGYDNVVGTVSAFKVTSQAENQAVNFTATITVQGVFPTYGVVS